LISRAVSLLSIFLYARTIGEQSETSSPVLTSGLPLPAAAVGWPAAVVYRLAGCASLPASSPEFNMEWLKPQVVAAARGLPLCRWGGTTTTTQRGTERLRRYHHIPRSSSSPVAMARTLSPLPCRSGGADSLAKRQIRPMQWDPWGPQMEHPPGQLLARHAQGKSSHEQTWPV